MGFFGAVKGDHPVQQRVIDVLVPRDTKQHFTLPITRLRDFLRKMLHTRPFGRNSQVLGGGAKRDDECPMVGKHGLIPCNLGFQFAKRPPHPLQHHLHAGAVLRSFDLRQIFCKDFHAARSLLTCKDQK